MADPDTFKAQLNQWMDHAKGKEQQFVSMFCLELAAEVQEATPVKTGNLLSAWRGGVNGDPGPDGSQSGAAAAASMRVGDSFFFSNYTSYAQSVEYGSRPHVIMPKGPPEGAKVLHWKGGGKDFFATKVYHPGYVGAAFVRGVMARAEDIAQTVANRLQTSDSNIVGGS